MITSFDRFIMSAAHRLFSGLLLAGLLAVAAFGGHAASAEDLDARKKPEYMAKRPKPEDLDFFAVKQALTDYLKTVPEKEQAAEKERIRFISTLRDFLIKMLKAPYDGEIKLKGRSMKGTVLCNENELDIKPRGSRKFKRIKWDDVPIEQYIVFFDYNIQMRLKMEDAQLKGKAGEIQRKKEAGDVAFTLALLCDWYNEDVAAKKYAVMTVEYNPALASRVQELLPLLAFAKSADGNPPPAAGAGEAEKTPPAPKTAEPEKSTGGNPKAPPAAAPTAAGKVSFSVKEWKDAGKEVEVTILVNSPANAPFNPSLWADATQVTVFSFQVSAETLPGNAGDAFNKFRSAKHGQRSLSIDLKDATLTLSFSLEKSAKRYYIQVNDQKLELK